MAKGDELTTILHLRTHPPDDVFNQGPATLYARPDAFPTQPATPKRPLAQAENSAESNACPNLGPAVMP